MSISTHVAIETPSLKESKPLTVAGLRKRYNASTANDIPALWQRMDPYFGKLPAQADGVAYGLVMNMGEADNFDYLAGMEVGSDVDLPGELSRVSIPAQRYAVFPFREHVSKLNDTMSDIWQHWQPAWGHRVERDSPNSPAMIEYYGPDFDPRAGTGDIEIWVPIKK